MHQIFDYEKTSELNPKLYEIISEYKGKPVVGGGCKTDIHLHHQGIGELTTLLRWIGGLVPLVSHRYSNPSNDTFNHIESVPDRFNKRDNYDLLKCECGMVMLNPRPTINDIVKHYNNQNYQPHSKKYNFISLFYKNRFS